jgi:hypothetical protein
LEVPIEGIGHRYQVIDKTRRNCGTRLGRGDIQGDRSLSRESWPKQTHLSPTETS